MTTVESAKREPAGASLVLRCAGLLVISALILGTQSVPVAAAEPTLTVLGPEDASFEALNHRRYAGSSIELASLTLEEARTIARARDLPARHGSHSRVVGATNSFAFVAELIHNPGELWWQIAASPRSLIDAGVAEWTVLATVAASAKGGGVEGVATNLDGTRAMTRSGSSVEESQASCELDCELAGVVYDLGALIGCTAVAAYLSVAGGLVCGVILIFVGVGVNRYCEARNSAGCTTPVGGFFPQDVDCGYDRCRVKYQLAPRGRTIYSSDFRLGWLRHTGEFPLYDNYHSIHQGPYSSLYPDAQEYWFTGTASSSSYASCTYAVDIYAGFTFTDGTFSSMFMNRVPKLSTLGTDPGCL